MSGEEKFLLYNPHERAYICNCPQCALGFASQGWDYADDWQDEYARFDTLEAAVIAQRYIHFQWGIVGTQVPKYGDRLEIHTLSSLLMDQVHG